MSNIKEAEEQTGISRANIRYYEKMRPAADQNEMRRMDIVNIRRKI